MTQIDDDPAACLVLQTYPLLNITTVYCGKQWKHGEEMEKSLGFDGIYPLEMSSIAMDNHHL